MLNFSTRLLNEFTDWLLFNCRAQFIIPSRSNRDRVVMRFLVVVEETCMISHTKLLPVFNLSTFWNAISWKCSLEDTCIRSSLIKCQSLFNRKININPKYRVLMFLPCTVHVFRSTWYREVKIFRVSVTFISLINGQEENCLSPA